MRGGLALALPLLLAASTLVATAHAASFSGSGHIRTLLVAGDGVGGCVPASYSLMGYAQQGRHTYGENLQAARAVETIRAACPRDLHQTLAYCQDAPTCYFLPRNFRSWDVATRFLRAGALVMQDSLDLLPYLAGGPKPPALIVESLLVDLSRWHSARGQLVATYSL